MTYILQLQLQRQLHHTTLHCTALPLDYTTATPQTAATTTTRTTTATATATATTQHYTDCTTLQLQVHYTRTTTTLRYNYNYNHNNNYNYACTYTTHWNTQQLQLRYTTLPLTLQLHNYNYTTLYPAVVGEMTTATTPRSTTLTSFRVISGFALPSMRRNNSPLLWCPMIETSTTALCAAQLVLLDVYRDDMIWYDTIWCDVMWSDLTLVINDFVQTQTWSDMCVAPWTGRWEHHFAAFQARMRKPMQLNTITCLRASRTCQWRNFPGMMSYKKASLPVHRRTWRTAPRPPLLLLKPISISTFSFAYSSPPWTRAKAIEPQLQAAKLWNGLTGFQNACCLDVQAC